MSKQLYGTKVILVKDKAILIVRRTESAPTNPEYWDLPGGLINVDEKPETAAIREVFEETNLNTKNVSPIGEVEFLRGDNPTKVTVFIANINSLDRFKLSYEHDDSKWISLNDLWLYKIQPWLKAYLIENSNLITKHINKMSEKMKSTASKLQTTLILIRHGETDTNVSGRIHVTNDSRLLNDHGKDQIKKTATKLKEIGITKLFSSNEERSMESAKLITSDFQVIDGIEERNWGIYEGKPWEEINVVLDKLTLDERYSFVPPNGESWKVFEERLMFSISELVSNNQGETIAVVTHGGVIRALIPALLGIPKEESFKYDPDNASISIFTVEDKKVTVVCINDTSHLD